MQRVKGAVLRSRLAFVEERFGKDALSRVVASLDADDQKKLRAVVSAGWYPFDIGTRFDDAIVRVLGDGKGTVFEQLGEASAAQNLGTVHGSFLESGQPHAFLAKANAIYRTYYDTGRREYKQTGATSGQLTTFDAESFSIADCLTIIGWHRRALECAVRATCGSSSRSAAPKAAPCAATRFRGTSSTSAKLPKPLSPASGIPQLVGSVRTVHPAHPCKRPVSRHLPLAHAPSLPRCTRPPRPRAAGARRRLRHPCPTGGPGPRPRHNHHHGLRSA